MTSMGAIMNSFENVPYLETLFTSWKQGDKSIDASWTEVFSTFADKDAAVESGDLSYKQSKLDGLIRAFRESGYRHASLNPLGGDYDESHSYLPLPDHDSDFESLDLAAFGLDEVDRDTEFFAGESMKPSRAPLHTIIEAFRETYCGAIGVEFLHIRNKRMLRWLMDRMESCRNHPPVQASMQREFLSDLIRVEEFEKFLGTQYPGQKRFSLEGSEVIIPALHYLVDRGAHDNDIGNIVLGTTHRGRLSILYAVLGMLPEEVFSEFEGHSEPEVYHGSGDVKYHIGYSAEHVNADGSRVHLSVMANPSHLEAVDSVVEGRTRAMQDLAGDRERSRALPVLIHGDAAFAGQGVVAETLNLSQLKGYTTGGTIHIVINNQIGFTTPARYSRSSPFPTDVAKALPIPIFHVNGDDPEAIIHVTSLALSFRQTFHQDVIIDIFCFRRHGHNEGDEPSFTHPQMYRIIEKHPGVAALYGKKCDANGIISAEQQERLRAETRDLLLRAHEQARVRPIALTNRSQGQEWNTVSADYVFNDALTGLNKEVIDNIMQAMSNWPAGFSQHAKLRRITDARRERYAKESVVDWSGAESLAFGSLLLEHTAIRMSGQDCTRGTFSQRHMVWWDTESKIPRPFVPLAHIEAGQAPIMIFDSPLSEYSVLAFEYGHSLASPRILTIWEAQFGDFANGAQVVIDNYITTADSRWAIKSGLVMLLPHGLEGQGPDHSCAHLERFLQLCAEDNIQVCNPTTPAQYFHLLRRQVLAPFRKPLIIMTPKSLLRHRRAVSDVSELTAGSFRFVLDDIVAPEKVECVVLCSGKIYYDLLEKRETMAKQSVAIIRLEQLYPFPARQLHQALGKYSNAKKILWAQEEHKNFGAWAFVREQCEMHGMKFALIYTGREASSSPASGSFQAHGEEQKSLVNKVLGTVSDLSTPLE
jgi:2-oxoglutarate dehydrogenase E1 component